MSDTVTLRRCHCEFQLCQLLSVSLSYRKLLRRPLFEPAAVPVDIEVIEERMEGKLEDFMVGMREHITTFISTVCKLVLLEVAMLRELKEKQ